MWDLCFSPDGSKLVTVGGNRVYVFDTSAGTLIQSLKGHTNNVVCTTFSKDGQLFASGSIDKSVIIWNAKFEGILKYTHDDPIVCLAFNPTKSLLISGSCNDIGFWSCDENKVNKCDQPGRVTCCSWTNDGQFVAIGCYNGVISIRNKMGEEKVVINRGQACPIWSIAWSPETENTDVLAVADWSQKLSFYQLSGKLLYKERDLGFDACFISWYGARGEFILIGGSNRKVNLYSKEGHFLTMIVEKQSWIWSAKKSPNSEFLALCGQDGCLSLQNLQIAQVHNYYRDRYTYRDNLTDVIVHHLLTDKKIRIKTKELIKKVALYQNKLLIQYSDTFLVYESPADNALSLQYKHCNKFNKKIDATIVMICSCNIITIIDRQITSLSFDGTRQNDWLLDSQVRYVKVVGGPIGREGLLVGLKNGKVMLIFLDNSFPVLLLTINGIVKGLDFNANRTLLAIVDEHNTCLVYDVRTKELLYQEPNANSVAWNTCFLEMLSFSFNGLLSIKSGNFPIQQQKQQGFVLSFDGPRIYCLTKTGVTNVAVPYSAILYQYIEKKSFKDAYKIGCLGVTDDDWRFLGQQSLENFDFEIARKSFVQIREIIYIDLVLEIEERVRRGEKNKKVILGDILALQGRYEEAADSYKAAGQPSKAIEMYTDLRMFNMTKDLLADDDGSVDKRALMSKQAAWATSLNDLKSAAEMYMSAGEMGKAIDIMGHNGWSDMLIEVTRKLDKGDRTNLLKCANFLKALKQYAYAAEIFENTGDIASLVKLQTETEMWDEAIETAHKHPEFKKEIHYAHAIWLAEKDLFEDAQKAFHKAGKEQEAILVLEQLTDNAVLEKRFQDASYYHWLLSMQFLDSAATAKKQTDLLKKFNEYQRKADIYYAYHVIQRRVEEPFTFHSQDSLFNISRYLTNRLANESLLGVSKVYILYTLVKQGRHLGAYKSARQAHEKFRSLLVPPMLQTLIDVDCLCIKSKPFNDAEELLPVCYHCSSTNPLLSKHGNVCVNCKHPFVFSFVYFETLPLIEFKLEDGLTDGEAMSLLELEAPQHSGKTVNRKRKDSKSGFDDDDDSNDGGDDEDDNGDDFCILEYLSSSKSTKAKPVVVNRNHLKKLSLTDVIICKWKNPLHFRYYKIAFTDVPIVKCDSCNRMFLKDDYELLMLQYGKCPFCRKAMEQQVQ
uniref:Intraflagellar transport protein 122 homolog n=1 Tax=Helobdella robusta TaxID=6412 RepID=T1G248_HELRO